MITFDMGFSTDEQAFPYRRFAFWQEREGDILSLAHEFFEFVGKEGLSVVRNEEGRYALSHGGEVDGCQPVTAEQMALHMALLWQQRLEREMDQLLGKPSASIIRLDGILDGFYLHCALRDLGNPTPPLWANALIRTHEDPPVYYWADVKELKPCEGGQTFRRVYMPDWGNFWVKKVAPAK